MISKAKFTYVASLLSANIAFARFVFTLILSIYLERNRPISPNATKDFVNYMKFIGRPFYISNTEINAVHILSISYLSFALLALILRSSWLTARETADKRDPSS
jgi:hypothetical protein